MKYLLPVVVLALALTSGCKPAPKSQMPLAQRLGQTQAETPLGSNEIVLVDARTSVRRGESCSITIQGKPDTRYTISATYKLGEKTMTTQETKNSAKDGMVTWSWLINNDTVPGSYPVTVSGGGSGFNTLYTVTE